MSILGRQQRRGGGEESISDRQRRRFEKCADTDATGRGGDTRARRGDGCHRAQKRAAATQHARHRVAKGGAVRGRVSEGLQSCQYKDRARARSGGSTGEDHQKSIWWLTTTTLGTLPGRLLALAVLAHRPRAPNGFLDGPKLRTPRGRAFVSSTQSRHKHERQREAKAFPEPTDVHAIVVAGSRDDPLSRDREQPTASV